MVSSRAFVCPPCPPPQKKTKKTVELWTLQIHLAYLLALLSRLVQAYGPQNPQSCKNSYVVQSCAIHHIGHAIKISGTRSAFLPKWPKSKRNFDTNLSGPSKWNTNFCPVLPTLGLSFTSAVGVWNKAFLFCHSEHETKHSWMQLDAVDHFLIFTFYLQPHSIYIIYSIMPPPKKTATTRSSRSWISFSWRKIPSTTNSAYLFGCFHGINHGNEALQSYSNYSNSIPSSTTQAPSRLDIRPPGLGLRWYSCRKPPIARRKPSDTHVHGSKIISQTLCFFVMIEWWYVRSL